MTITFFSDVYPASWDAEARPCRCVRGSVSLAPENLRAQADETCPRCGGKGLETRHGANDRRFVLANDGAHRLLALLRFHDEAEYLGGRAAVIPENPPTPYGSMPNVSGSARLFAVRQALLYARATFVRRARFFERDPVVVDGQVKPALRAEQLSEYLSLLEELCEHAEANGGTVIQWC